MIEVLQLFDGKALVSTQHKFRVITPGGCIEGELLEREEADDIVETYNHCNPSQPFAFAIGYADALHSASS